MFAWESLILRETVKLFHFYLVPSVRVTTTWRVRSLLTKERPPDMEGGREYTDKAVPDSRNGVVLQVGGRASC